MPGILMRGGNNTPVPMTVFLMPRTELISKRLCNVEENLPYSPGWNFGNPIIHPLLYASEGLYILCPTPAEESSNGRKS